MLESTKELLSTLFFQISAFLGRVTVPGMTFTFKTFFIGVFLFAMLVLFLRGFFGFGDTFAPVELGKLTRDKITARRRSRAAARQAVYDQQIANERHAMAESAKAEERRNKKKK